MAPASKLTRFCGADHEKLHDVEAQEQVTNLQFRRKIALPSPEDYESGVFRGQAVAVIRDSALPALDDGY